MVVAWAGASPRPEIAYFEAAIAHHNGTGGVVAQPFVFRRQHHGDGRETVKPDRELSDPYQIADDGAAKLDRVAAIAHNANAEQPLSRRLSVPQFLERDEVSVEEQEDD